MSTQKILPAEWAPQDAIMLTWPHANTDWGPILDKVEKTYFEIARAILEGQDLVVSCEENAKLTTIGDQLKPHAEKHGTQLHLFNAAANDTWARDHGPISIYQNQKVTLLDFTFNAWGAKFDANKDDKITSELVRQSAFPEASHEKVDFILEGGSIESDGLGTLLTTEKCLLTNTRNASLTKPEIESKLQAYLGIKRVLWLKHGYLSGDDTDAHIDTLARFCSPNTITYVTCDNPQDDHFDELKAMEAELSMLRTTDGQAYKLIPLPMTDAIYHEKERLPATYANFLITNQSVLLPVYDVPQDHLAISKLKECFPERKIIPINCRPLIIEHGSLHCITMQLPAGTLKSLDSGACS